METGRRYEAELQDYEFFEYPEDREELYNYSKSIAEYLRAEGIQNLVIIDRSSRPLYVGVREYLKSQYPEEELPNMYFMNPKGFKAKEDLTPAEIDEIMLDCMFKSDAVEGSDQVRTREEILQEFQDTYKKLMNDRENPVLLFDTCIHSGGVTRTSKKSFRRIRLF